MKFRNNALIVLSICFLFYNSYAQVERMNSFMIGYVGGYDPNEDIFENNIRVHVEDTGLVFSERIHSDYELCTPCFTHNDEKGKSLLHWQGCYLLDAETLSPIENGDYLDSEGASFCEYMKQWLPELKSGRYSFFNTDFMLTRDDKDIYLFFERSDFQAITPIKMFYSLIRYDEVKQSWYVHSKYNLITEDYATSYEGVHPIRHANGIDWWILIPEIETNKVHAYLLDESGVHYKTTSYLDGSINIRRAIHTSISPSGDLICSHDQKYGYIISTFDRCCGSLTVKYNGHIIDPLEQPVMWSEFSPSGRFIYLSTGGIIYQYDLEAADFYGSEVLIAVFDGSQQGWSGGFERPFRATNGRIYSWAGNTYYKWSKMDYPDRKGPEVGWHQDFYTMPITPPWSIQTFPDYTIAASEIPCPPTPCPTIRRHHVDLEDITVFPSPVSSTLYLSSTDVDMKLPASLYNMHGQEVWSGTTQELKNGLSVASLPSGVYALHIEGRAVKRVVKI